MTKIGAGGWANFFASINLISSIIPLSFVGMQIYQLGLKSVLFNLWSMVDVAGCAGGIFVSFCIFWNGGIKNDDPKTAWSHYRVVAAFTSLLVMWKALYFMKLNDRIAPLIFTIVRIFNDIIPFLIVFFIVLFSFSCAFYLVG